MMIPTWGKITAASALLIATLSSGAMAFSDIDGIPEGAAIRELKARGIVNGMNEATFAPKGQMTSQQAIALLVKGFDLNIDHIRFIKQPEAGDYFTNVSNDAWYAEAFIIAHLNGLPIPKDIDPNAPMTREQFVNYLMSALNTKGEYAFIQLFMEFADTDEVTDGHMTAIQHALVSKIATLNDKNEFRPGDVVTRAEAAIMMRNAIKFVEEQNAPKPDPTTDPDEPVSSDEVSFTTKAVTDDVQLVTLSWGEQPNPGYRITVSAIEFTSENSAVIRYQLHTPVPGQMYAQVITKPTAAAYLPSGITDIQLVQTVE